MRIQYYQGFTKLETGSDGGTKKNDREKKNTHFVVKLPNLQLVEQ